MLHNRKNPSLVSRAYLYSAIAKLEGAELFYFTPGEVNLKNKTINGLYYHQGKWLNKRFPFPDVVINSVSFSLSWQKQIENALKKTIPFTSYPVGSKNFVYEKLKKSSKLKKHVIPYQLLNKKEDLISFLNTHSEVIVKPTRSHHGNNVVKIAKVGKRYLLTKDRETKELSEKELGDLVFTTDFKQLVQKYISSKLPTGEPFDFRIHLQKNRKGIWTVTYIVPRIGNKKAVITNLSQGSQMIKYDVFMDLYFGPKSNELQNKINDFASSFGDLFDSLYPYKFDELGVDVGLDENHNIWIYEVNWRPGHVFIEVFTGFNTVNYAIFLATQKLLSERKNK
jgi:glutathione synthase/RimK-type ligase-like ATP-grasp enzyme